MKRPSESVIINNIDAATTMEIVRDLRNMGLVQGKDFEFRYNPTKHDPHHWEEVKPRGAEFYFREGKWTTFVTLKYGK